LVLVLGACVLVLARRKPPSASEAVLPAPVAEILASDALALAAIRNVMYGETAAAVARRVVGAIAPACPNVTVPVHARAGDDADLVHVIAEARVTSEDGLVSSNTVDGESDGSVRRALQEGAPESEAFGDKTRILRPIHVFGEAHGVVEIIAEEPPSESQLGF